MKNNQPVMEKVSCLYELRCALIQVKLVVNNAGKMVVNDLGDFLTCCGRLRLMAIKNDVLNHALVDGF